MNIVTVVSWTEARMSPRQVKVTQLLRVHKIGGMGRMTQGTRLVQTLEKNPQRHGSSRHELEKAGHLWHRCGFVHPSGLGALQALVQFP
jgi:hypothetical protein